MTLEALTAVDIDVTYSEHEAVVTLHRELDLETRPDLEAAFVRLADRDLIVVDLADVTFIDVSNIGLIQGVWRLARSRGADLVLRSPRPHVSRILELTCLGPMPGSPEIVRPIVLPLPASAYERRTAV